MTPVRAFVLPVLLATACAHGPPASSQARNPALPAYDAQSAGLFDDSIDANAVGLADVVARPKSDAKLRLRVQDADVVARMKVSTVTVDAGDTYHVQLSWSGRPFVDRAFGETRLELVIRPTSPAFGVVKWQDSRLIGKSFIGFVRRFAGAEEPALRFHLSADSLDVAEAVVEARALDEAAGR